MTTKRPTGIHRDPAERAVDLARAVNMALAGATFRQIANDLEVSEQSVRVQLLSPEGQRALRHAVNELQERTDRFLASAHLQALRVLVREMENAPRPGDRINAARAITGLATRRIEITGAEGGPLEVAIEHRSALTAKLEAMRARAVDAIETSAVELGALSDAERLARAAALEPAQSENQPQHGAPSDSDDSPAPPAPSSTPARTRTRKT